MIKMLTVMTTQHCRGVTFQMFLRRGDWSIIKSGLLILTELSRLLSSLQLETGLGAVWR